MPKINGHVGRKAAITVDGKPLDVWVFPQNMADEIACIKAAEGAMSDGLGPVLSGATFVSRMARKQDGSPVWADAQAVTDAVTTEECLAAMEELKRVDAELAEGARLGNP